MLTPAACAGGSGAEPTGPSPAVATADATATALASVFATKDAAEPATPPLDPGATQTAEALAPLKAPDFEGSPASPCFPTTGEEASITINPDTPSPRCAQLSPSQRLRIVNNTSRDLPVRFGPFDLVVPPGESRLLDAPVETYLAPGGHQIEFPFPPFNATLLLVE